MSDEESRFMPDVLFLQSADDRREFTLPLYSDRPGDPLQAFNRGRRVNFRANETVIAFQDQPAMWLRQGLTFSVHAVQIPTDDAGRPRIDRIRRADVAYDVSVQRAYGNYSLVFDIRPESLEKAMKAGFRDDFPPLFERPVRKEDFPRSDLDKSALDVEEIKAIPLLPHHPLLARTARHFYLRPDNPGAARGGLAGVWKSAAVIIVPQNAKANPAKALPPVRPGENSTSLLDTENLSLLTHLGGRGPVPGRS